MGSRRESLAQNVPSSAAWGVSFVFLILCALLWCSSGTGPVPADRRRNRVHPQASIFLIRHLWEVSAAPSLIQVEPPWREPEWDLHAKIAPPTKSAISGDDGQFSFGNIPPGPFQLSVAAEGFAAQALSGTLQEGENYNAPRIALTLATKEDRNAESSSRAWKWRKSRSRRRKSSACSASFQISMSATFRMQLRSIRSKNSN